jgi:hypothetical protein
VVESRCAARVAPERWAHPGLPAALIPKPGCHAGGGAVGSENTERDLENFLTAGPSWMRKLLRPESWSPEDSANLWWWRLLSRDEPKLLKLLQPYPDVLREYRERCKQAALKYMVPAAPRGRPRKDVLASQAAELQRAGQSYAQIAKALNRLYGPGATTAQAVRKLIQRKRTSTTEKS